MQQNIYYIIVRVQEDNFRHDSKRKHLRYWNKDKNVNFFIQKTKHSKTHNEQYGKITGSI